MTTPVVCPLCHNVLEQKAGALYCATCSRSYPLIEGIVSFTGGDEFYEGRFAFTHGAVNLRAGLWRWLYQNLSRNYLERRLRFLRNNLIQKGKILDLGCGGGIELLRGPGREVTGVDLSIPSLKQAAKIYDAVYRADVTALPFAEETFDCVLASELLGHLPLENKQIFLQEVCRVLKPDGKILLTLETQGFLRNWAVETDPGLYQKYLVEQYGHIGLQPVSAVLDLVKENKLEIKKLKRSLSYIWPSLQLLEAFDNDYRRHSILMKLWVWKIKLFYQPPVLRELYDLIQGAAGDVLDCFAPPDHACELYLVLGKKD